MFAKKDLEMLLAEMGGVQRLHRVLGPVSLTALGIGCIIGAGIFVSTGLAAADQAGPSIMISFAIAGLGCAMAALCYAEFASMAPVAGSVYTYAYTTLGEIFAWIVGWDLILEYSMGCATVASAWSNYFNKLLAALFGHAWTIPQTFCQDPFTPIHGTTARAWLNLPSVVIMFFVTLILIIGIRESARTNAVLVIIKIAVVLFVIGIGTTFIDTANWTEIPVTERILPQERVMPDIIKDYLEKKYAGQEYDLEAFDAEALKIDKQLTATYRIEWAKEEADRLHQANKMTQEEAANLADNVAKKYTAALPETPEDKVTVDKLIVKVREEGEAKAMSKWGLLGYIGLNRWLRPLDDAMRSPFMPYGFSGMMLGAAIVFFAFIGFDSISTHAEEAKKPQRDVPIGIIVSLSVCTVLYIAVAAVITGMVPYPSINIHAPIAAAFMDRAAVDNSLALRISGGLIAAGGLAGMTSVLLVLFLSQARIFMAMARDGLLPKVFGQVHPRFRTPYVATMVTGVLICITAAFTPIHRLEEMVNIGTLLAFAMVCLAVMILRIQKPGLTRPFRCPALFVIGPLGIVINVALMLFLPLDSWLRLLSWLVLGMLIYFLYSRSHSHLTQHLMHEISVPGEETNEDLAVPNGE